MELRTITTSIIQTLFGFIPFLGWAVFLRWYFLKKSEKKNLAQKTGLNEILLYALLLLVFLSLIDALFLTYFAQGILFWFRPIFGISGIAGLIILVIKTKFRKMLVPLVKAFAILALFLLFAVFMYGPIVSKWVTTNYYGVTSYHLIDDVSRHVMYVQEKSRANYIGAMTAPNAYPNKVGAYYYGMHSAMSFLTWYTHSFQANDYLAAFLVFLALNLAIGAGYLWRATKSRFIVLVFLVFIFFWNNATDPGSYSLYAWFTTNPSGFAHFAIVTGLILAFFSSQTKTEILWSISLLSIFSQAVKAPVFFLNYMPLAIISFRWLLEKNSRKLKNFIHLLLANLSFVTVLFIQKLVALRDPLGRSIIFKPRDFINENFVQWESWTSDSWWHHPLALVSKFILRKGLFLGLSSQLSSFILLGTILLVISASAIIIFWLLLRYVLKLKDNFKKESTFSFWGAIIMANFVVLAGFYAPMLFAVKEPADPKWRGQFLSWDGLFNSLMQSIHFFGIILSLSLIKVAGTFKKQSNSLFASASWVIVAFFLLVISGFYWRIGRTRPVSFLRFTVSKPIQITQIKTVSKEKLGELFRYQNKECPKNTEIYIQTLVGCRSKEGPYWYFR